MLQCSGKPSDAVVPFLTRRETTETFAMKSAHCRIIITHHSVVLCKESVSEQIAPKKLQASLKVCLRFFDAFILLKKKELFELSNGHCAPAQVKIVGTKEISTCYFEACDPAYTSAQSGDPDMLHFSLRRRSAA